MPYAPLRFDALPLGPPRDVFNRASDFLADVYTMLHAKPRKGSRAGECNLTSVLVLLAVVDAMSAYVYPKRAPGTHCSNCGRAGSRDDIQQRFTQLIRDRLPWSPAWMDKGLAAKVLYLEIRNLLVHELGVDRPSSVRASGMGEPVAGRWGRIPTPARRMDRLDARKSWPASWPAMEVRPADATRATHVKVSCAALYWAVKHMCQDLLEDVRAGRL